ncbi:MAG: sodium:solute symporter, partial [Ruminococcus sp.]|nr:sodium:solute symporter [Ruminococcus sp.]
EAMRGLAEGENGGWEFASFLGPQPLFLLFVVLLTSLGTWGLPQMVQKFYAIKHERDIKKGTVISTCFAIVVAGGCYFLGGFGRLFDVDVAANGFDAIIPEMLSGLPDLLIAVVVILVLSASMSTLSSLVIASSSTLTIDLIKGNIIKKMSEKKEVLIIRIFIVVFIAISAIIAVYQYQSKDEAVKYIAQLMGISWGALAGAFLAPFLYGLYWKKTTKLACWVSFVFGAGIMLLNMFFRSSFPVLLQSPINCGAFAMLAGLIIVPVISLLSPKPDKKLVDDAFACYDKKVPAAQKNSLD